MRLVLVPILVYISFAGVDGLRLPLHMKAQPPGPLTKFRNAIQKVVNPSTLVTSAALCAAVALGCPIDALAAPPGSRKGGSSFRSAAKSYGSSSISSQLDPFNSVSFTTFPTFSPFSQFSPFPYRNIGYSPVISAPVSSKAVAFIGFAVLVYLLLRSSPVASPLSRSYGGHDDTASVVKVQVALNADWTDPNCIMTALSGNTTPGSGDDRSGLGLLLSETALSLLRAKQSWTAASVEVEQFRGLDALQRAEPYYQRRVVDERSKFEKEVTGPNAHITAYAGSGAGGEMQHILNQHRDLAVTDSSNRNSKTHAVVSLLVVLRGRSDGLPSTRQALSAGNVARWLQALAAEGLSSEGENLLGMEVLWTPAERGRILTERDLLMDYPELVAL